MFCTPRSCKAIIVCPVIFGIDCMFGTLWQVKNYLADQEARLVSFVHTLSQSMALDEHPTVGTPEADELNSWWMANVCTTS